MLELLQTIRFRLIIMLVLVVVVVVLVVVIVSVKIIILTVWFSSFSALIVGTMTHIYRI